MVQRYLDGQSLTDICEWLDNEGVKAARGGKWTQKSVSQLLRNEILVGRRIENGRTALRCEPILDWPTFNRLQAKLDSAPSRRGLSSTDTALLTGIVRCDKCDGPMYRIRTTQGRFYRCATNPEATGAARYSSKCANMMPLADFDAFVDEQMTGPVIGGHEILETITVPGDGHQDEIDQIEIELRSLNFDAPRPLASGMVPGAECIERRQSRERAIR